MTKSKFISDILFYRYMINENLPINKQDIDEIPDEEPDESDWFAEEEDRQDDNPND